MSVSIEPLWKADALDIVREAYDRYQPVAKFVLFSGGNDSSVLTHWAWERQLVDGAVFIDTGTALPGVRDFAREFCDKFGIPLTILRTSWLVYEDLVLEHGFPGPASHRYCYVLLKERRVKDLVRAHKRNRRDCVALLAGCRRHESQRRMGTSEPITKQGGALWVNPILDWTTADMRLYRSLHELPESKVAALLHRSGECNCGAFASDGERNDLLHLFPDWFQWIEDLEDRAAAEGLERCRWGEPLAGEVGATEPLCSDCQLRMDG